MLRCPAPVTSTTFSANDTPAEAARVNHRRYVRVRRWSRCQPAGPRTLICGMPAGSGWGWKAGLSGMPVAAEFRAKAVMRLRGSWRRWVVGPRKDESEAAVDVAVPVEEALR